MNKPIEDYSQSDIDAGNAVSSLGEFLKIFRVNTANIQDRYNNLRFCLSSMPSVSGGGFLYEEVNKKYLTSYLKNFVNNEIFAHKFFHNFLIVATGFYKEDPNPHEKSGYEENFSYTATNKPNPLDVHFRNLADYLVDENRKNNSSELSNDIENILNFLYLNPLFPENDKKRNSLFSRFLNELLEMYRCNEDISYEDAKIKVNESFARIFTVEEINKATNSLTRIKKIVIDERNAKAELQKKNEEADELKKHLKYKEKELENEKTNLKVSEDWHKYFEERVWEVEDEINNKPRKKEAGNENSTTDKEVIFSKETDNNSEKNTKDRKIDCCVKIYNSIKNFTVPIFIFIASFANIKNKIRLLRICIYLLIFSPIFFIYSGSDIVDNFKDPRNLAATEKCKNTKNPTAAQKKECNKNNSSDFMTVFGVDLIYFELAFCTLVLITFLSYHLRQAMRELNVLKQMRVSYLHRSLVAKTFQSLSASDHFKDINSQIIIKEAAMAMFKRDSVGYLSKDQIENNTSPVQEVTGIFNKEK